MQVALYSMLLLLLAMPEQTAAQDAAAGEAAIGPPFQLTLNGGCANATVVFYLKHYYNHTDPDAVPLPASCAYQANETLPASFFAAGGGGGGGGPNVTVGSCIRWPGAVEPASTTVGPSSTFPVWYVSAALTDGRGLRYGGPGEQFWDPLGRPCAGLDAPNCLAFARVGLPPALPCSLPARASADGLRAGRSGARGSEHAAGRFAGGGRIAGRADL